MSKTSALQGELTSRWPGSALRLMWAFGTILGLFAVAAATSFFTVENMFQSGAEVASLQAAGQVAHEVGASMREQYIHQAHTLLEWNTSHLPHYDDAARTAVSRADELLRAPLNAEERLLATAVQQRMQSSDTIFRTKIVPSMAGMKPSAASTLSHELEAITTQVVDSTEKLNAMIMVRSQTVKERALLLGTQSRWVILCCFGLAILLALVLAISHVRHVADRLNTLRRGVFALAQGDLSVRIGSTEDDEFGELARHFDDMAGALQVQQTQLLRAKTLASLGEMAAAVAHEINNPLSVILGYTKIMQRTPGVDNSGDLEIIEGEVRQCQVIVKDLLDLARPARLDLTAVDVVLLIRDVVTRQREVGLLDGIEVDEAVPNLGAVVVGDEQRLRQVLVNVITNAAQAMPKGGTISITVEHQQGSVRISISDTGLGIEPNDMPHVVDPFFSTKANGTGLGLTVCQSIMEAHNGTLAIETVPGCGTAVSLVFRNLAGASSTTPRITA